MGRLVQNHSTNIKGLIKWLKKIAKRDEIENPNGSPAIRGYNIIAGKLSQSSDGETFLSHNPAWLEDTVGEFPLSTEEDVQC